jgi:phosphosulfolactate phosphohydrolase-like enzyme
MEIFGENSIEVVDDYQKVPIPVQNLLIGEEAAAEKKRKRPSSRRSGRRGGVRVPGRDQGERPVRLYLKEMGAIPLLNPEGGVTLAKRIEDGNGRSSPP